MNNEERFWSRVHKTEGCWEWTAGRNGNGYGVFTVRESGGKRRHLPAHRVAFILSYGPIPDGLFILHACDNPGCVNPYHLRIGTQRENIRDAMDRGRWKAPPIQRSRKLFAGDGVRIRARHAAGESPADIAEDFGISIPYVCNIVAGRKCRSL